MCQEVSEQTLHEPHYGTVPEFDRDERDTRVKGTVVHLTVVPGEMLEL